MNNVCGWKWDEDQEVWIASCEEIEVEVDDHDNPELPTYCPYCGCLTREAD